MLQVQSISVFHDEIQALWSVTFSVQKETITALVGANGAGKTTTLCTIAGLLCPREGSVFLDGVDLKNLEAYERVELGISLAPEGKRLFPFLTVQENLEIGAYANRARRKISETLSWVYGLFPRLQERKKQLAGTLSGGEQQMLTIGRGLMSKPRLMMLDEPSLGLAPIFVVKIFELIKRINREGVTILLVEQNVQTTLKVAHQAFVIETGRIVMEGASSALLTHSYVKKAYLGI